MDQIVLVVMLPPNMDPKLALRSVLDGLECAGVGAEVKQGKLEGNVFLETALDPVAPVALVEA